MNTKSQNHVGTGLKPAPTTAENKHQQPRRKSLRLRGYDYSLNGAYFVTICTHDRTCLFGRIIGGRMSLNDFGKMVEACWQELQRHYLHVALDEFVVMPNHVHGIILLAENELPPLPGRKRHPLFEIVRAFKTFSSRRVNNRRDTPGRNLWQRGYYEHIIRSEESLSHIREYVETNPLRWHLDHENPEFARADGGAGLRPAPTRNDPDLPPVPW